MKLVIAGKSFVACRALSHAYDILQLGWANYELAAMLTKTDNGEETWQPSLRCTAEWLQVPVYESFDGLALAEGDIVISLEYDRLIREKHLNGAKAYNIHFSNLPLYRGCLTSVWPLRHGQTLAGVTLHIITPGVDDGAIISQRVFEVPEFFSSYDLYAFYNSYGFELFKENFADLLTGNISAVEQNHEHATVYRRDSIDFTQVEINDFNKPACQVHNDFRALIFEPYQLPTFRGQPIAACDMLKFPSPTPPLPGEVVLQTEAYAIVGCQDGYVRLEFHHSNQLRLFMVRSTWH